MPVLFHVVSRFRLCWSQPIRPQLEEKVILIAELNRLINTLKRAQVTKVKIPCINLRPKVLFSYVLM